MLEVVYGDISNLNEYVDVIVNASNGIGFMGGYISKRNRVTGIAESLNFRSNGLTEKTAMKMVWKNRKFRGYRAGEVFKMDSCGLNCKEIYNAVTMFLPGTPTRYSVVGDAINEVFNQFVRSEHNSIAIPLLGAGTGLLKEEAVESLIRLTYDAHRAYLKDKTVLIVKRRLRE